MKDFNERRKQLTLKDNINIIDAYLALHPLSLSKISISLFNIITKGDSSRLFNDEDILLKDLLNRCHPVKYAIDKKPVTNDVSNLMTRLQDLEEGNVFYVWKFGKPISYAFFMEKDIGVWKYFNSYACVPPKTLKEILSNFNEMVDAMEGFEDKRDRFVDRNELEYSFLNKFIPHVMEKMDNKIADQLPRWDRIEPPKDYLEKMKKKLNKIKDYDNFEEAPEFYIRIPKHLSSKINESKSMNTSQLAKDLIPEDENIVIEKKKRTRSSARINKNFNPEAEKMTFKSVNPFLNCNEMLKYYRDVVRSINGSAKFYDPSVERQFASEVIDVLTQNGRANDVDFLRSWIRYYVGSYLNGTNIKEPAKTSLSNFKKTFQTYDNKYFRV